MGAFNLLFTIKGRLSRAHFWLAHLALSVGWIIVVVAFAAAIGERVSRGDAQSLESLARLPLGIWLLVALLSYMSWCVSAKRLHDLDKSAWWMVVFQGPATVLWLGPPALIAPIVAPLYAAVWIVGLWFLVELGLFRGTDGVNRFDGGGSTQGPESGSSWADKIQFPEERPLNPSAPRIPKAAAAKAARASSPQGARTAPVRGPAKPAGFGRRGLGAA
jgi:uncharacterized membrane protein YhaH (DUF805 family)